MGPGGNDRAPDLRDLAEQRIEHHCGDAAISGLGEAETQHLVRELQVHEAELQIQNEELVNTQRELAQTRDRFIDLYEFAPVGYLTLGPDGCILEANITAARMFDLPRAAVVGGQLLRFVAPDDQRRFVAHRCAVQQTCEPVATELTLRRADGTTFDALLQSAGVVEEGTVTAWRTTVSDISAQKAEERARREADAVIRAAVEGVVILDGAGRITRINPALGAMVQCSIDALRGKPLSALIAGDGSQADMCAIWPLLEREHRWRGELQCRRCDGGEFPVLASIVALRDEQLRVSGYAGLFTDITEQKSAERQLRTRAYYDPVTGLPNRTLFDERIEAALREAQRHGQLLGLAFVDLDRFKQINDNLGHEAGDVLLRAVAQRLSGCVRGHDTVARLGGDEFALLLTDVTHAHDVATVADKILMALGPPMTFNGREIRPSASVGISVYPDDARDVTTLRRYADLAMYRAKAMGRNTYSFFTESMTREVRRQAHAQRRLNEAMRDEDFRIFYQPIVDAATGAMAGVEALLRWQQPGEDPVTAETLLSLAEDTGQIVPLGRWVMSEVFGTWSAWHEQAGGDAFPFLSINVSPRQLRYTESSGRSSRRSRRADFPVTGSYSRSPSAWRSRPQTARAITCRRSRSWE